MIWCPRGSTPAPHRSKSEEWQRPAAVLDPHHWDATTDLARAATQTWALRSEGRIILIDTGAGNGEYRPLQPIWSYLDADYLDNLAAALARDFRRDRRDAGIPRVARPCRSCEPGRHGRDRRRGRHRQRLDPVPRRWSHRCRPLASRDSCRQNADPRPRRHLLVDPDGRDVQSGQLVHPMPRRRDGRGEVRRPPVGTVLLQRGVPAGTSQGRDGDVGHDGHRHARECSSGF